MTTLIRLDPHPTAAPHIWDALAQRGGDLVVVVNVAGGPGTGRDPSYTAATTRLRDAGITMLGYVDLEFAMRPAKAILADVGRWAGYPVHGVFLDRAPVSPFSIGPVAVAVQAARRAGLTDAVLNPATPPDPTYRGLGAAICVFEGSWKSYLEWDGAGAEPGDGHLIHSVPGAELERARSLQAARGAGFGTVTHLPPPWAFASPPTWSEEADAETALAA